MVYRKRTIMKIANFTLIKMLNKTQKNRHPQITRESGFFVFFAPRRLFCVKNQYFGKYEALKH